MPQMILPIFPREVTLINQLIGFAKRDGQVYYFNGQMPIFIHGENDLDSFKMFMAQLFVTGGATQSEINKVFGLNPINMKRWTRRYREGGPGAFYKRERVRRRKAQVMTPEIIDTAQALLDEAHTGKEVAEELGLKVDTLRKAVREGKLRQNNDLKKKVESPSNKSQRSKEDRAAALGQGCTRLQERIGASIGQLTEATTCFEKASDVINGGVLLSLPALLANGLLKHTRKYFSLPKGYYNLQHIFITLAFAALLRIKNIESIQYYSPGELGKVIGLDRVAEVKTIREKLDILARQKNVQEWNSELSKEWMESAGSISGLLYVDGRVRVYHGKKTKLPKRYVTREKLCLRGMSDYWVNDAIGQPYFVVSSAHNKGLLSILKSEIIPTLLKEVPNQPTKSELTGNPQLSRFSVIFDREGYSPEFFKQMWEEHCISCYTYKKYPGKDWPKEIFKEQEVKLHNGEVVRMLLAEKTMELSKKVNIREIRRLTQSGHQTAIITTDFIPDMAVIAGTMFARWSQENFFKYMREHFGIDRLIEYGTTPIDETEKVVNPAYRDVESRIRSVSQKLSRKVSEFGRITLALEGKNITEEDKEMKKYVMKKSQLQEVIELYETEISGLKEQRKQLKKHIEMGELPECERFSSLKNEKKHIMDTIKMIDYRAETAMASMIEPKISKRKATRVLVRQIFSTEVDLVPDTENNILNVSLHSLSNEKSNKIAQDLCKQLNETETVFPGTEMRLVYKLVSHDYRLS